MNFRRSISFVLYKQMEIRLRKCNYFIGISFDCFFFYDFSCHFFFVYVVYIWIAHMTRYSKHTLSCPLHHFIAQLSIDPQDSKKEGQTRRERERERGERGKDNNNREPLFRQFEWAQLDRVKRGPLVSPFTPFFYIRYFTKKPARPFMRSHFFSFSAHRSLPPSRKHFHE